MFLNVCTYYVLKLELLNYLLQNETNFYTNIPK